MAASDMVLVQLVDGNRAAHPISMRGSDNKVYKYGYRRDGEVFMIRSEHQASHSHKFKLVEQPKTVDDVPTANSQPKELAGPTPLSVFTASEDDKEVAYAERSQRTEAVAEASVVRKRGPQRKTRKSSSA